MSQKFNLQTFVAKKTLGLIMTSISLIVFLSLISHNLEDPGFGRSGNALIINNLLGFYGSFLASFLLIIFGYTSYLFVLFFLIAGFKYIFNKKPNLLIVRFFLLLVGLTCINTFFSSTNILNSLVGTFFKNLLESLFQDIFSSKILFFVLMAFLIIFSFFILSLSLSLKLKTNFIKTIKIIVFFKFLLTPFRKIFLIFSFLKKTTQIIPKNVVNFKKSEPTIKRNFTIKNNNNVIKKSKNLKGDTSKYILPSVNFLKTSNEKSSSTKELERRNAEYSKQLEKVLSEYGVEGKIISFQSGPVVTLFEFVPAPGVKTSKVVGLSGDIARTMSSLSTRISSQPGKTTIGIEIPNQKRQDVYLGDLIKNSKFFDDEGGLRLALGKDISGGKIFTDLERMPHLLIAGTTGSGKSVGINSMIVSLLLRFKPSECKLILIDPKMLELSIYQNIPHLLTPVVTNPNKAVFALKWVVREMENRYRLMSSLNVKNISSFNSKILKTAANGRKLYREVQTGIDRDTRKPIIEKKEIPLEQIPLIVVVIDEMADLMMVAGKEVENLVQRLAQMARASGIHIIAATQRPSVDVITGTIKANFPSRISFRVASRFDSRTILNEMGAEQLLGSGDMLFLENGANLTRLHGGFVSESEIEEIVNHIKNQFSAETTQDITVEDAVEQTLSPGLDFENKNVDELYEKAVNLVIDQQKVSTSFVQRYLQIGYNRAARIVEKMEEEGIITEASHSGKRSVIKKN